MRILGKGKTALAIKDVYSDAKLYDDNDLDIYDEDSDEITVVSPGIPPYNQLVQNTKNLISDYDLFLDENKFSIWISGTNGKTTTTQMMGLLLKESDFEVGGNIGVPLGKLKDQKKLILETSSFTLHYTSKAKPNIYILLPISDDHISWHGSYKEYAQAKLKPLSIMNKDDIAIVPSEYRNIKTQAQLYSYKDSEDLANQFSIDINQIKFAEPFLLDSLLALVVQKIVNEEVDYDLISSFKVDPHKVEEFRDHKNRLWVDDSKATNIDATIWALKGYKNKKIYLILGGDDKNADLTPLFLILQQYDLQIYAIGQNTDKLDILAQKFNIKIEKCYKLENAVYKINKNLDEASICLLSPAAASLDQYSSYRERGLKFKEFINSFTD